MTDPWDERYIYLLIYHKNQPSMYLDIPFFWNHLFRGYVSTRWTLQEAELFMKWKQVWNVISGNLRRQKLMDSIKKR